MTPPLVDDRESGMTLIELLIALVIMAIISVSILGSITTLSTASQNQRGIANIDAATLSYAEAIKHHVHFTTTVPGGITSGATSFTVSDASELTAPVELSVDGELMKVGTITGALLSNVTRGDRDTTATAHTATALINPVYTPCPMAAQLAPTTFTAPTYVSSVRITEIDYWIPSSGSFVVGQTWSGTKYVIQAGRATCESAFQALCPSYTSDGNNWANTFQSDNEPECDPGLERVTITATGDNSTANTVTTTTVLVRRANG